MGYKTQKITVAGKSDFYIVMQVDVDGLDKVVIKGYSQTSERLRTKYSYGYCRRNRASTGDESVAGYPGKSSWPCSSTNKRLREWSIKVELRGRSVISPKIATGTTVYH